MADEKDDETSEVEDEQTEGSDADVSEALDGAAIEEPIIEQKKLFGKIPLPTLSKKLKMIIGVVFALIVLGAVGDTLYSMGFLDSLLGIERTLEEDRMKKAEQIELGTPVYYEQPEFIADLKSGKCRGNLLKLSLTIQLDEADEEILKLRQPKIIDRIQQHLRSQTKQDLTGKAGADTLRKELVLIVNATIKPAVVHNILFRSFIIQ